MTLTRAELLRGLLAVVGMGQATTKYDEHGRKQRCVKLDMQDGIHELCNTEECGPGEERCPRGHCQKPRTLSLQGLLEIDVPVYDDSAVGWHAGKIPVASGTIEQRVCSTCGIVYVPMKEK